MPIPKYCWDAGLFIAWLTDEQRTPDEIAGLREVADLADRGQAIICTSALSIAEVLGDGTQPEIRKAFDDLFKRPHFQRIPANDAIFRLASDIRIASRSDGRVIRTADATYIATAIAYRLDELHTFDDKLLNVSGRACAQGLTIIKPRASQTILAL